MGGVLEDETVTVADPVAFPPAPVHVIEYVVEVVGETEVEPLVPLPEKPVVVHEEAFVELHVRVEDPPEVIEVGDAERETVGAGVAAFTDIVADPVALPPAPVHVTE